MAAARRLFIIRLRPQKDQQNWRSSYCNEHAGPQYQTWQFQIVPVIKCEGLWVISEVIVFLMLDLMLQYWYRRDGR